MKKHLHLEIRPQPTDESCGPTCLHAIYGYFGDEVELADVVREVPQLATGGTLGVQLGCHALARGYEVVIYTYNLLVFDPTWFNGRKVNLAERLARQAEAKGGERLRLATEAYVRFLQLGGQIRMRDLSPALLRAFVIQEQPVIVGLSSTYLYQASREVVGTTRDDDLTGEPAGHFAILHGYNRRNHRILVADPYQLNPHSRTNQYEIGIDRVICAILLGIVTYDGNLLIIRPRSGTPVGPA